MESVIEAPKDQTLDFREPEIEQQQLFEIEPLEEPDMGELFRDESVDEPDMGELFRDESVDEPDMGELFRDESVDEPDMGELFRDESVDEPDEDFFRQEWSTPQSPLPVRQQQSTQPRLVVRERRPISTKSVKAEQSALFDMHAEVLPEQGALFGGPPPAGALVRPGKSTQVDRKELEQELRREGYRDWLDQLRDGDLDISSPATSPERQPSETPRSQVVQPTESRSEQGGLQLFSEDLESSPAKKKPKTSSSKPPTKKQRIAMMETAINELCLEILNNFNEDRDLFEAYIDGHSFRSVMLRDLDSGVFSSAVNSLKQTLDEDRIKEVERHVLGFTKNRGDLDTRAALANKRNVLIRIQDLYNWLAFSYSDQFGSNQPDYSPVGMVERNSKSLRTSAKRRRDMIRDMCSDLETTKALLGRYSNIQIDAYCKALTDNSLQVLDEFSFGGYVQSRPSQGQEDIDLNLRGDVEDEISPTKQVFEKISDPRAVLNALESMRTDRMSRGPGVMPQIKKELALLLDIVRRVGFLTRIENFIDEDDIKGKYFTESEMIAENPELADTGIVDSVIIPGYYGHSGRGGFQPPYVRLKELEPEDSTRSHKPTIELMRRFINRIHLDPGLLEEYLQHIPNGEDLFTTKDLTPPYKRIFYGVTFEPYKVNKTITEIDIRTFDDAELEMFLDQTLTDDLFESYSEFLVELSGTELETTAQLLFYRYVLEDLNEIFKKAI